MMKKLVYSLIFCLLFGMTGCVNQNQPENTTKAPEVTGASDTADETTGNDEAGTTEEPVAEVLPSILDDKKPLDETGVFSYIYNEYMEDGIQQEIYNFQENLLISSSYYDDERGYSAFCLELVSLQTGELLSELSLEELMIPQVQILDHHVAVSDAQTGMLYLLDAELKIEKELQMDDGMTFFNKKMSKAYCFDTEAGVQVIDLNDGTKKRWLPEAKDAYVSKVCGDNVTFTYTDKNTYLTSYAVLNLAADEIDILDLNKSFYGVEHNSRFWLAGLVGKSNVYLYATEDNPQTVTLASDSMPGTVKNADELIVTSFNAENDLMLTAYRVDGTYLSEGTMENAANGYWGNIIWFESLNGYLFTCIDETGTDRLYFWDIAVEMQGENLVFEALMEDADAGDSVSDSLYEKAEEIGRKYGVTIKIADQCETDYGNYIVDQNMNEDRITKGLEILEQSLSSYPEGFIRQLCVGYHRELEINLMGSIYAVEKVEENKNGFSSFIAFVQQQEEKYVMIFDLSRGQLIEQDLYHEFSHLIDKKIAFMVNLGQITQFSEEKWAALNPKDFDYAYSYTDVPTSYYYDGYEDYFVDVYSRTFPTEDRARILEYAMIGAEFCFETYPGLVTKLEYYCACIREAFDTTGWPDVTKWEEMLFLVD